MLRVLTLALALVLPACATGPDDLGHWWRKEPLADEVELQKRALEGPVSPMDDVVAGDFVGWFGVIVELEREGGLVRLRLDQRYADRLNVTFGIRDDQAIHTVSLFGEGPFEGRAQAVDGMDAWLPGDLVRFYGDVVRVEGVPVVAGTYVRYWPRWAYELTPARPVRGGEGRIARDEEGWPVMELDSSVPSPATAVDGEIRDQLLERFQRSAPHVRMHIAFTLGELDGDRAIALLTEAAEVEPDPERRQHLQQMVRRARREIGPQWRPDAPYPYWKAGGEAEHR